MKKKIALFSLALCLLCSLSFINAPNEVTIHDALKQGLIELDIKSRGGHDGQCIDLKVVSTSKKNLMIAVPAGTRFKSEDEGEQDIFIVNQQHFLANKGATINKAIAGYCCQYTNSSPSKGSDFTLNLNNEKKLNTLAKYMNANKLPNDIKQEAVWAVSNNKSVSGIYADNNPKVDSLRKFICRLTGQKEPWYRSKDKYTLDPYRNIVKTPISIHSSFVANIDKGGEIHYEVLNEAGENTSMSNLKGRLPSAGEYNMKFNLTVEGWEKGKYRVQLIFEGTVLHEKPFEIG